MEYLQQLLDGSTVPLFTAFLLGLLTAISPCPLATNIAAVGYISRDMADRRRVFINGLLYTLGRVLAYTILGAVLITVLREGASLFAFQKTLGKYGELLLAPALILMGLFMLFGHRLNLPSFGFTRGAESMKRRDGWGALLLGLLFAMAFCPTSGVLYFGMLIPMSAAETGGYWFPLIFAVATALPVIVVAWILAFSVAGVGRFYNRMQSFQRWFNLVIALLFILIGLYYAVTIYF